MISDYLSDKFSSGAPMQKVKPPKVEVNISELGENDVFVIHVDGVLTKDQRESLKKNVNDVLNSDLEDRVLLLECNLGYSIIRRV